ncbi:hypothetical protein KIN20_031100, partial [Parelaphostrongylus tenuis]
TDASVRIKAFGIAESGDAVRVLVSRLAMQTKYITFNSVTKSPRVEMWNKLDEWLAIFSLGVVIL